MRISLDKYLMAIAHAAAARSTCLDKQVGCVVVDAENRILATGYNGPAPGKPHCTTCNKPPCPAVHAEANALYCTSFVSKPHAIYCTLEPCQECEKLISDYGLKKVVFSRKSNKAGAEHEVEWIFAPDIAPWPERVRAYHRALGIPVENSRNFDDQRNIMLAMFMEMAEVVQSFQWKPWKAGSSINADNFLEELSDIMIFMDSALSNFGLSWNQLFTRLDQKIIEVEARLNNGYHTKE